MEGDQFSLSWNNFQNNLSSGFNLLYQDEDLVDVTLAAGGKYLKAHKTVLSVCSPYFKELFRANPCKHPIVILPSDVNYKTMSNLLTFMYQGEVSVRQEEIPNFMRIAEALKVKGLTDHCPNESNGLDSDRQFTGTSMKTKPPVKKLIRPIHRPMIETSISPSVSPVPQKQARLNEGSDGDPKIDPLNIRPKEEPTDQDMDEFIEQEEQPVDMSSMLDTTLGEPSDSSTPRYSYDRKPSIHDISSPGTLQCIMGKRGNPRLVVDGHTFYKKSSYKAKSFWYCKHSRNPLKCPAVCWTVNGQIVKWPSKHTHGIIKDAFNPVEDSIVPIEKLQEVLQNA